VEELWNEWVQLHEETYHPECGGLEDELAVAWEKWTQCCIAWYDVFEE
jgi:hypothetical protein